MDFSQLAPYTVIPILIITIVIANVIYFYLMKIILIQIEVKNKL